MNWEAIKSSGLARTIQLGAGGSSSDASIRTGGPNAPCATGGGDKGGSHPSTFSSVRQLWDFGSHTTIIVCATMTILMSQEIVLNTGSSSNNLGAIKDKGNLHRQVLHFTYLGQLIYSREDTMATMADLVVLE